ncbi:MAG TPA: homoserine kinase [Opitutaceae bacterium]|jgi:homoserine kinase|nr:homoserine kinase [Opitutaceae bacterium]
MTAPAGSAVTVRVPGSTSNCGAGFDSLGLAVQLYNEVTVAWTRAAQGGRAIRGGPARAVPAAAADARASAMAASAAAAFFRAAGRKPRSFRFHVAGDVPVARGLGSSVTVIAGVIAGLNALSGAGLSRHDIVGLVTAEEGHPDNASAGVLGGFCVARCEPRSGKYLDTVRFAVPDRVALVVASPEAELLTRASRGVLPRVLPYFDAVRSINSAAYVVAAFAAEDYERLRHAGGDFMHEPYRLPRIRGAAPAIAAGVAAGAHTGWLSGSGSSVLCVAERPGAAAVAAAMLQAFAAAGVKASARVLAADNYGLRLA